MNYLPAVLCFLTLSVLPVKSDAMPSSLDSADGNYRDRQGEAKARKALEQYRLLYQNNPTDCNLAWRTAMACHFVGLRFARTDDEKKGLFIEGRDIGLASLRVNRNCAGSHFWTAVNMALYGQAVGPLKMLFTLGEIEEHLRATVELDPAYAAGGGYRILGLIQQALPGILGGSNDKAKDYFEMAISAYPKDPLNYFFLARIWKEGFSNPEKARAVALAGLRLPRLPDESVESSESRHDLLKLAAGSRPTVSN